MSHVDGAGPFEQGCDAKAVEGRFAVMPLVDLDRGSGVAMTFVRQRVELAVAAIFTGAVDELASLEFPVGHGPSLLSDTQRRHSMAASVCAASGLRRSTANRFKVLMSAIVGKRVLRLTWLANPGSLPLRLGQRLRRRPRLSSQASAGVRNGWKADELRASDADPGFGRSGGCKPPANDPSSDHEEKAKHEHERHLLKHHSAPHIRVRNQVHQSRRSFCAKAST